MNSELRLVDGIRDGVDERGVGRIVIDRPERMNALDGASSRRIIALCEDWATRTDIRVVVVSGDGGAFCAGADVADMADGAAAAGGFDETVSRGIIENGSKLVGALRSLPMPVVAALDGAAVGIGASLAVAADLVYATARTYFLLAFVNIGLMPDGGASALFAAAVGRARANEMALLGEKFWAADALAAGLINGAVDDSARLDEVVGHAVGRLLKSSPEALAATKSALDGYCLAGYDDAIEREIAGQTRLLQAPAFQKALGAFARTE